MIKMLRVPIGNYRMGYDWVRKNGWKILSVQQSSIYGKTTASGRWIGDWLIKIVNADWFNGLPYDKQIQIVEGKVCSQFSKSLRCLQTEGITSKQREG